MLKMGARAGMVRWVSLITAMGAMFRALKTVLGWDMAPLCESKYFDFGHFDGESGVLCR